MNYYNNRIQLDINVIKNIFANITPNTKMLVFGLGYDSKMWYEGNKNTFFIENKDKYINLNTPLIPFEHIIKYEYNITCETSTKLTDEQIEEFQIPEKIRELAPFDIILIDGPEGYSSTKPGRLIPCYWSTYLSKKGTLIYIDDSNRPLESYCIDKYFSENMKYIFMQRNHCTKIYM